MHLTFQDVNAAFWSFCSNSRNNPEQIISDKTVIHRESRNGPVIKFKGVTTVTYLNPTQRVLLNKARDANPFFHLYESLWMLNGQNDVASLDYFNSNMKNYSDDGVTFWGAYGYRWRKYFGYDQIEWIVEELRANPDSRRCVLQMWDGGRTNEDATHMDTSKPDEPEAIEGTGDLYVATHGGKDVPCNISVVFEVEEGKLNMTVFNRSNDLVWGMFGANLCHFSILQEYVANLLDVHVGIYNQCSSNLHIYKERWTPHKWAESQDFYPWDYVPVGPIVSNKDTFNAELQRICESPVEKGRVYFSNVFLRNVCKPMFMAFERYKEKDFNNALLIVNNHVGDQAWAQAARWWLDIRKEKHESRSN